MSGIASRASRLNRGTILSSLWIFAMFNYLYADVMGLMDSKLLAGYLTGNVNGLTMTPLFLLFSAILMETAILMVFLPRILPRNANRIVNIIAGTIHTLAPAASLFVGSGPAPYYAFCVAFELPATIAIIVIAVTWKKES